MCFARLALLCVSCSLTLGRVRMCRQNLQLGGDIMTETDNIIAMEAMTELSLCTRVWERWYAGPWRVVRRGMRVAADASLPACARLSVSARRCLDTPDRGWNHPHGRPGFISSSSPSFSCQRVGELGPRCFRNASFCPTHTQSPKHTDWNLTDLHLTRDPWEKADSRSEHSDAKSQPDPSLSTRAFIQAKPPRESAPSCPERELCPGATRSAAALVSTWRGEIIAGDGDEK
ncbi:hypothetical protein Q8A67_021133 [Cirrhinus molitorella]|uniref:Uncharacterized protein n=1 Tax=Cirrhinus molitorella TaxID=172907 RepID=A0AA88PA58_9TELE|nr:hypothetical protein Q8A67_021133 [Cirrhinus molitorella]